MTRMTYIGDNLRNVVGYYESYWSAVLAVRTQMSCRQLFRTCKIIVNVWMTRSFANLAQDLKTSQTLPFFHHVVPRTMPYSGFGTIFRGWECSHSIRSEILLRYRCPRFFLQNFQKKNEFFKKMFFSKSIKKNEKSEKSKFWQFSFFFDDFVWSVGKLFFWKSWRQIRTSITGNESPNPKIVLYFANCEGRTYQECSRILKQRSRVTNGSDGVQILDISKNAVFSTQKSSFSLGWLDLGLKYLELGDKLCCKMTVVASRIRQT